jgi:ribosomal protein S18 acetylase RimI-like enzyme
VQVEIRSMTEDEVPALVAEFGQEAYFRLRLAERAAGVGEALTAWLGERAVGDLFVWRAEPYEPSVRRYLGHTPTLTHLEVTPGLRGQGIGAALMAAGERLLAERGYARVCLGVGIHNASARRLYDRLGYRDWRHGLVLVEWEDTYPDGSVVPDSEVCHWLVRNLDNGAPDVDAWQPWSPSQVAAVLAGIAVPWAIAGGWAVDLHLGRPTRPHEDIEIAIPRADFPVLRRALARFELYDVGDGRIRRLTERDDPVNRQVWTAEPAVPAWRMDTFLEPGDRETWVSHRDPAVRLPMVEAIRHTAAGIPYLAPTTVLLNKAKHLRDKDMADFDLTLPTLSTVERQWLADALDTVHPGHGWTGRVRP